jgi:diguanylate cyclase (GGDEF)-like protein
VTPISIKSDVPSRPGGARRPDLAARLKARLRTLRTEVERREALADVVREANATVDPQQIAAWLVRRANGWIPADCWAVIAHDINGHVAVIADLGLSPALGPSLWSVANWVMRHGTEFFAQDLEADNRAAPGASGAAIGFPLVCRNNTVGALVALDVLPSAASPAPGPALIFALRGLFEAAAIALDNALALQKAEALSVTDDLTRLYNSRYLNQVLRRETKRASRSGRPLSLLFLDLDGFKAVNDTYGHLAGSKVLVEVAAIMRRCARETDVVARFGGDEFSLVLPETGRDGAVSVASRIRERLSSWTFLASEGLSVHLTASIGVATLPDVAASSEELIRAADMAMYRVKAAGKDGIYVAQE